MEDSNRNVERGTSYEQELQNTKRYVFRVQGALKTKGVNLLVNWKDNFSFNTWINTTNIV